MARSIGRPDSVRRSSAPRDRVRIAAGIRRVCEDLWDSQGFTGAYGDTLEFKFRIRAVGMTVPNLISQVLPWSDVASPFLDRDIYEFCNTLDAKALAGRQLQLRWAMRHFPATTELPRLKDGILIPVKPGIPGAYDEALKRHWRGVKTKYYLCRLSGGRINLPHRGSFPFYGQWYRRWKHVRDYVDGIVLSERCLDRGLWRQGGCPGVGAQPAPRREHLECLGHDPAGGAVHPPIHRRHRPPARPCHPAGSRPLTGVRS